MNSVTSWINPSKKSLPIPHHLSKSFLTIWVSPADLCQVHPLRRRGVALAVFRGAFHVGFAGDGLEDFSKSMGKWWFNEIQWWFNGVLMVISWDLPSGKLALCYWKCPFIVDFPINGMGIFQLAILVIPRGYGKGHGKIMEYPQVRRWSWGDW